MALPEFSEILVSQLDSRQILERISSVTAQEDNVEYAVPQSDSSFLFNGKVKTDSFYISEKVSKADSFLPLITGKIEPTPKGAILFLDYRFFPSTLFFLGFWSVITALLTVFFLLVQQNWVYALVSFSLGALNYFFAKNHFRRKVKRSQYILHQMLETQLKD
jgi:hypothetical protein